MLLLTAAAYTQDPERTINGSITDADTGEPIPFSHLYIEGTQTGTAAGTGGRFRFSVDPAGHENARVVVSAVGYETLYISLEKMLREQPLELKLKPVSFVKDDALVTATRLRNGRNNNTTFWWRMGFNRGARGHFNPRPFDHISYGLAQPISTGREEVVRLRYIELRISSVSSRTQGKDGNLKPTPADSLLLRFRFTGIGEDGMPDEQDLLPKQILKTIPAKKQRLRLDVADFNIQVSCTFYLITELLIEDPETDHGFYPLFESIKTDTNNYFRFNPADSWRPPNDAYFTEMVYEVGYEY